MKKLKSFLKLKYLALSTICFPLIGSILSCNGNPHYSHRNQEITYTQRVDEIGNKNENGKGLYIPLGNNYGNICGEIASIKGPLKIIGPDRLEREVKDTVITWHNPGIIKTYGTRSGFPEAEFNYGDSPTFSKSDTFLTDVDREEIYLTGHFYPDKYASEMDFFLKIMPWAKFDLSSGFYFGKMGILGKDFQRITNENPVKEGERRLIKISSSKRVMKSAK